ncbi:hypothetical protein VHUM_02214 [Vanrija humicola]|uniref:Uncharacterized protein n=1 Tax=Vanrija humicola TaxID=5417 RepID=A0A7D8V155_VANHU|nr:hypothetical protein VHUM_02214 [Vanrija humicola]
MKGPPFGTASAYTDSFPAAPPRELTVSAETCFNLTVFRDVVRQYRKLDDQVVTRLNRAQAQLRDEARVGKGSSPEGMCAKMWTEMIAGWTHRQTLLTYCIGTVEGSMAAKRAAAGGGAYERGVREEQAVSDSLHSESSVEAIVRKGTLEAFKTRCPFFTPPPGRDRGWWDIAESGRTTSKGPE